MQPARKMKRRRPRICAIAELFGQRYAQREDGSDWWAKAQLDIGPIRQNASPTWM